MERKVNKGCSVLNATDESANPHGLILSEREREIIYGRLNSIENATNALLHGRTGWRPQVRASFVAGFELVGITVAAIVLRPLLIPMPLTFVAGIALIVLQKLDLLLTHEGIEDTHARRNREDEKEAKERARYFKDMGCKDMSLEE